MAKIQEVFYQYYSKGNNKYFKAPFVLYFDTNGMFIMRGGDGITPTALTALSDIDADKRKCLFGFDEITPEPFIIGEHQLGDYNGDVNTWMGVHKFPIGC